MNQANFTRKSLTRFLSSSFILCLAIGMNTQLAMAQSLAINTDGSKANPNAILDIKSSTKGLLIPRMSTSQRLLIPQTNGLLVYDVNTKSFWYSDGESWKNMATDVSVATSDAWLITGNAGTVDNVNFLGTTDNKPLNFRVNNEKAGRIDHTNRNTFFGHRAGFNIAAFGTDNTAMGSSALFSNTSGTNNTAVGANALQSNTTGFQNSAYGRLALLSNVTGFNNTAVGLSSMLSNTTGQNNSAVGTTSLYSNTTGSNNVAIGGSALNTNTTGSETVAIGVNTLRTMSVALRNTAVGVSSMEISTGGSENAAYGYHAMYGNSGSMNTSVGGFSMHQGSGNENTAVGYEALRTLTSGTRNVAVGVNSLFANSTGGGNVAVGFETLRFNTIGNDNVAIGRRALRSNDNGMFNVAVGLEAMTNNLQGLYNFAGGYQTMFNNSSGTGSTAVGYHALYSNTTGYGNVAFGSEALMNNVNGFYNTTLGTAADVIGGSLNNATAIGYNAKVDRSNKVRIGNSAVTVIEGQVPFTTPSDGRYKFNVKEDVKGLDFILQLRPVTYQFDVKRFDGSNASFGMQAAYDEAIQIRRSGFIAQEVEAAAQKTGYNFSGIIKPKTEKDHYSLSYESFVVPLVKAMQEQQKIIDDQNKRMDEQDKKINLLLLELEQLKKNPSE